MADYGADDVIDGEPQSYSERLRTPWWWYPVGLLVATLLAAEFRVAGVRLTIYLPFILLWIGSVAVVYSFGRFRVEIIDGELHVGGAHLSLEYVSGVVALDERTLRRVVGREGDPQAFVCIRSFVGPGVQVWIDDPDDPTPYWVFSTRHPKQVVDLLRSLASSR